RKISEDAPSLINDVADAFAISATSVRRYLEKETAEGHILPDQSHACGYQLQSVTDSFSYDLRELHEQDDDLAYDDALPLLPENPSAGMIWQYVLTEIFNNAIAHSQGSKADLYVESNHLFTRVWLTDNGIGIFANILSAMKASGMPNPKLADAVTELYKGKFTSMPEKHSGEGIFFSMRLLDKIAIISDDLVVRSGFLRDASYLRSHLLAYYTKWSGKGTMVMMQLENQTGRIATDIFSQFADVDEGFIKTRIPILEACMDREPVSRSQARRICNRLDHFREAVLDFEKVSFLGQGFADEMFRVFQKEHPQLKLTPVNMAADVQKMYLYTIHNKVY
ncbi:MAG: STAS-like domain-containing protein, partial [Parasporobacterium sp.]|nr:STAS-like domain-containing protein [Parasporobacterium sp.]